MNRRKWKRIRSEQKTNLARRRALTVLIIMLRSFGIYKPPYNLFLDADRYCDLEYKV